MSIPHAKSLHEIAVEAQRWTLETMELSARLYEEARKGGYELVLYYPYKEVDGIREYLQLYGYAVTVNWSNFELNAKLTIKWDNSAIKGK